MKRLSITVLLIVLLCGWCHCQCEVLNEANLTKISHCKQLYDVFEEAMIENEINLFTLRQSFFSGKHRSPSLLIIRYNLQINGRNITKELLWTAVSLFKFVHPSMFTGIESVAIASAFNESEVSIYPTCYSIHLSLVIKEEIDNTSIMHTLLEMTTKV